MNKQLYILAVLLLFQKSIHSQIQINPYCVGVTQPTDIQHAGDGRLFVCEQNGKIRIINSSGTLLNRPFLDISNLVSTIHPEQDLLGLAFSPIYSTDGAFFIYYTDLIDSGNTVVARYEVSATDPDSADANSGTTILTQVQPERYHNGGCLQFGTDNYLYIGLGDGGLVGDPNNTSQNLSTFLGKILRIDVLSQPGTVQVPPDNPFYAMGAPSNLIWHFGLRNPWRFSFDTLKNDLWIGDVGQGNWEELDKTPLTQKGLNLGWSCRQGAHNHITAHCPGGTVFFDPQFEYDHTGGNCSITQGYVYRGALVNSLYDKNVYGDYCSGKIYTLTTDSPYTSQQILTTTINPSTFGVDVYGELYVADYSGAIYKFGDSICMPVANITSLTDTFYCGDSVKLYTPFNPALTYQWFYNGTPINNATSNVYYATQSGNYTVYTEKNVSCFNTSQVFTLGNCITSLQHVSESEKLKISPNPNAGSFEISGLMFEVGDEIKFIDSFGRTIYSDKILLQTSNFKFQTSNYSNGVFFLQLKTKKVVICKKVIIQK